MATNKHILVSAVRFFTLLFTVIFLIPEYSDAVIIKVTNGTSFEGVVEKETNSSIVLNIDGSQITIYKIVIATIDGMPYASSTATLPEGVNQPETNEVSAGKPIRCRSDAECEGRGTCVNGECMKTDSVAVSSPNAVVPMGTAPKPDLPEFDVKNDSTVSNTQNTLQQHPAVEKPTNEVSLAGAETNEEDLIAPVADTITTSSANHFFSIVLISGVNFSWGSGKGFEKFIENDKKAGGGDVYSETYWGLRGGLGISIRPLPALDIQSRILYEQKGAAIHIQTGNRDYVMRLSYLSIPVIVQWNILPKHTVSPFLYAGPVISKQLTAYEYVGKRKYSLANLTNTIIGGIQFGSGTGIKFGRGELFFETGYTFGITPIVKKTGIDDILINTLSIEAGYRF